MNEKVLVVDDEHSIANALEFALTKEGYDVKKAYDGEEALSLVDSFKPQVMLLDLMLPKISGYDVCRKLENKGIGIIMLTARNDIIDKVLGLELGADDYLTKPFDIREVTARVRSLVRRLNKNEAATIETAGKAIKIGQLTILPNERSIFIDQEEIIFTAKEFDLIYKLISNTQRVFSREELLNDIWGYEYYGGTRTVDTHVQRIRKKLGEKYQNIIETVHGIGYKGIGELNEIRD
jgi:two-component system alkaline phosphatase synthesis response regulator PhoP